MKWTAFLLKNLIEKVADETNVFFIALIIWWVVEKNAILKMTSSDILNWMDIPEKSKWMKSTLPKIVSILQPC